MPPVESPPLSEPELPFDWSDAPSELVAEAESLPDVPVGSETLVAVTVTITALALEPVPLADCVTTDV